MSTKEYLATHKRCIKRGKYMAVYQDPETKLYEIWSMVEQYDWTDSKAEAIAIMQYEDKHFWDGLE